MRFSKKVVIGLLCFLGIFSICVTVASFITAFEPTTLIGSVFGFCSLEGGLLAWLKYSDEHTPKDR